MDSKKVITQLLRKVGKAMGDYQMLEEKDDKILVAVSGGKDSLTLIDVLNEKLKVLPFKYRLFSVYVDFGFVKDKKELEKMESYLQNVVEQHFVIKKRLDKAQKKFSCFWCSWNRRKEIFLLAKKLSCKKVAFGHTLDDIVVTFLMNLFYHGEISTMPAKLEMFNGEIVILRPLVYVTSEETQKYAEVKKLPVVKNIECPYYLESSKIQRRIFLKQLIDNLQQYWPNIKLNIFNSLKKIKYEYLV